MTVAPQATAPAAPASAAAGGAAAAAAAAKQQSAATAAAVGKQQEDESVAIFQRNWQVMVYILLGKAGARLRPNTKAGPASLIGTTQPACLP